MNAVLILPLHELCYESDDTLLLSLMFMLFVVVHHTGSLVLKALIYTNLNDF